MVCWELSGGFLAGRLIAALIEGLRGSFLVVGEGWDIASWLGCLGGRFGVWFGLRVGRVIYISRLILVCCEILVDLEDV